MAEEAQVQAPAKKYPSSFLFGFVTGCCVQAGMRPYTMEPFSARPLSYLKIGLAFGVTMWYWDYFRRVALEHVLEREDKFRYHRTVQAMNHHMRIGDEDEMTNLTEYLAGSSTRV